MNMEDLKALNGKVLLDDSSEIDLKPAIQPPVDYGDWEVDEDIALIRIDIDDEDILYFKDKDVNYHELYFIEENFWFDLGEFYFILSSDDYLYEKIYRRKFILVFLDKNNEQVLTLNFIKRK